MNLALTPVQLGPITLTNRFVKTATYEGMSPGGRASDALAEHHAEMARRQVALTTVAYGAVSAEGRTFGDQLLVQAAAGLERVTDAVRDAGGRTSLQLAHCGGFTKLRGRTPMGPSAGVNAYGIATGVPRIRAMRERDCETVVQQFVDAACTAKDAGFDAVELHLGHGYLLSQFWSPAFNRRRDAYGGDRDGRARLLLEVSQAVVDAVGDSLAVIAKINLDDGLRGGADLEDCLWLAAALERVGVHAIIPSGGTVQRTAFYLLRGGVPLREMAQGEGSLLTSMAMRFLGRLLVKPYRYESGFLHQDARQVLGACSLPIGLLGGVDSSELVDQALSEGFSFVVMGRALLSDPDFIERIAHGETVESRCDHCNRCVAAMNLGGVRCVSYGARALVARSQAS